MDSCILAHVMKQNSFAFLLIVSLSILKVFTEVQMHIILNVKANTLR
jgi:hypothetical protein